MENVQNTGGNGALKRDLVKCVGYYIDICKAGGNGVPESSVDEIVGQLSGLKMPYDRDKPISFLYSTVVRYLRDGQLPDQ